MSNRPSNSHPANLRDGLLGPRPLLVVVSGPSGSGKTAVVDALQRRRSIRRSISATTRAPRTGEQDGIDYHFLTVDAFRRNIREGRFIEWARYGSNYYGTFQSTVEEARRAGEDLLLTIDVRGGAQIRAQYREAVLVFVLPPDMVTLRERLTGRGTEAEATVQERLQVVSTEIRAAPLYDYVLINEDGRIEETAALLDAIIAAEQHRMTMRRATRFARFRPDECG